MKQMVATEQIENIKTDSEIVDVVNNAIASGQIQAGGKLYVHRFYTGTNNKIVYEITTTDKEPYTLSDIIALLYKLGYTSFSPQNKHFKIFLVKQYYEFYGSESGGHPIYPELIIEDNCLLINYGNGLTSNGTSLTQYSNVRYCYSYSSAGTTHYYGSVSIQDGVLKMGTKTITSTTSSTVSEIHDTVIEL